MDSAVPTTEVKRPRGRPPSKKKKRPQPVPEAAFQGRLTDCGIGAIQGFAAQGWSIRDIAAAMSVCPKTVRNVLSRRQATVHIDPDDEEAAFQGPRGSFPRPAHGLWNRNCPHLQRYDARPAVRGTGKRRKWPKTRHICCNTTQKRREKAKRSRGRPVGRKEKRDKVQRLTNARYTDEAAVGFIRGMRLAGASIRETARQCGKRHTARDTSTTPPRRPQPDHRTASSIERERRRLLETKIVQ
jgi:hypothetical protein